MLVSCWHLGQAVVVPVGYFYPCTSCLLVLLLLSPLVGDSQGAATVRSGLPWSSDHTRGDTAPRSASRYSRLHPFLLSLSLSLPRLCCLLFIKDFTSIDFTISNVLHHEKKVWGFSERSFCCCCKRLTLCQPFSCAQWLILQRSFLSKKVWQSEFF